MKRTSLIVAVVSVMAVAALAAAAWIWGPPPVTESTTDAIDITSDQSSNPVLPPGSGALRATINPETGGVDISTSQSPMVLDAETQNALRRDTEGLTQVFHPNGMVSSNLQGRFQNVSVVRIDKDGKLVICSENADQIEKGLQNRAGADPKASKEAEVR